MFHVSCLVHWILLCEVETYAKQLVEPKEKRRSRRKVKGKAADSKDKLEMEEKKICSTFCPECQGTGIRIDGEELEKPTVPLSEVHNFLILVLSYCWTPHILSFFLLRFFFTFNIYLYLYMQIFIYVRKLVNKISYNAGKKLVTMTELMPYIVTKCSLCFILDIQV